METEGQTPQVKPDSGHGLFAQGLKWRTPIVAQVADVPEVLKKMAPDVHRVLIKGTAIDDSTNKNGWSLDPAELDHVAEQFKGGHIQLRVDHSDSVDKVIGRVLEAVRIENRVDFVGEVVTANRDVLVPIMTGIVDHVSIKADAMSSRCGVCGKPTTAFTPCSCEGAWDVISGVHVTELSVVTTPAYQTTGFVPVGFSASISQKIQNQKKVNIMVEAQEKKPEPEQKKEMPPTDDEVQALRKKLAESEQALAEMKKAEEKRKAEEEKMAEAEKKAEEKKAEEEKAKCGEEEKKAQVTPKPTGKSAGVVADSPGQDPNQVAFRIGNQTVGADPNVLAQATTEVMGFFASKGVHPVPVLAEPKNVNQKMG